jgi:hypothetical protein
VSAQRRHDVVDAGSGGAVFGAARLGQVREGGLLRAVDLRAAVDQLVALRHTGRI